MEQYSVNDYTLSEVKIRLCLKEGDSIYTGEPMDSPERAINIMKDVLKDLDREHLLVVNLSATAHPINFSIVSIGTITESLAVPANLFKTAILSNAAHVIILHNHPSGSNVPSSSDKQATTRMQTCGRLLGINVLDHIIVSGFTGELYSFLEHREASLCKTDEDIAVTEEILAYNGYISSDLNTPLGTPHL